MSALHVVAVRTQRPDEPLSVGHIVVDTSEGYVHLDLGSAVPRDDDDEGGRWVSLHPGEARALAAALQHFAKEAS